MLNNLQSLYQGLRANTNRNAPAFQKQLYSQTARDNSLEQARQQFAKNAKRHSLASMVARDQADQENTNTQNITDLKGHYTQQMAKASKNKDKAYQSNTTVVSTESEAKKFKPKQDRAPLGARDEYKEPGFMQGTESPPSCSLTASPERTTEKKLASKWGHD